MNSSHSLQLNKQIFLIVFAILCATAATHADEGIYPKGQLSRMGYQEAAPLHKAIVLKALKGKTPRLAPTLKLLDSQPAPQLLPWPVTFENNQHNLGNNMIQFQSYGGSDSYFHGGCDLRTAAQADIRTPVAGKLDAGHYGYEVQPDGSMKKFWTPYPQHGDDMYFEVSVITDDGLRYEFHHVDRNTLPSAIKQKLDHGNARVEAGEIVGHVHNWPITAIDGSYYHHTHYNIIAADGTRINPESVSWALADTSAPEIHGVYAVSSKGVVTELSNGGKAPSPLPAEIIVAATDKNDPNVYTHPPTVVELKSADGKSSGWNFKHTLLDQNGKFPNIHEVFKDSLVLPNGDRLETEGDYENNFFLVRLVVPAQAQLPFEIRIEDSAGTARVFLIKN